MSNVQRVYTDAAAVAVAVTPVAYLANKLHRQPRLRRGSLRAALVGGQVGAAVGGSGAIVESILYDKADLPDDLIIFTVMGLAGGALVGAAAKISARMFSRQVHRLLW